jgi:hypothetical protein
MNSPALIFTLLQVQEIIWDLTVCCLIISFRNRKAVFGDHLNTIRSWSMLMSKLLPLSSSP